MTIFTHDHEATEQLKAISRQLRVTNELLQSIDTTLKAPSVDSVEPDHLVIKYGPVVKQPRK